MSLNSLRTRNRKALDQLSLEMAERHAWNEANPTYDEDNVLVERSAPPDIVYKQTDNALVVEEPDLFSEDQVAAIGEALGQTRIDLRQEWTRAIVASERDLHERFGARLRTLEDEVKALRATGPRLVKDAG